MTEQDDSALERVDPYQAKTFTVTGVSRPVPYLPAGTCQESSRWLAEEFAELEYVEGNLVVFEDGKPSEWLEHAWTQTADGQIADATIRPAAGVQWKHIPAGPEHDAERAVARYALRKFGPPVPFDQDESAGQESAGRAQAAVDAFYASQDVAGPPS